MKLTSALRGFIFKLAVPTNMDEIFILTLPTLSYGFIILIPSPLTLKTFITLISSLYPAGIVLVG